MSYRSSNILRWIFFKFQHNLNIDKPWSPFVFDGILNCCSRVMGLCSSKFRDFIECPTVAQISFDGFFSNFNTILIFINPDPLSFLTEFWIVVLELCDFVRQNFVISLTVLPYRIYHVTMLNYQVFTYSTGWDLTGTLEFHTHILKWVSWTYFFDKYSSCLLPLLCLALMPYVTFCICWFSDFSHLSSRVMAPRKIWRYVKRIIWL